MFLVASQQRETQPTAGTPDVESVVKNVEAHEQLRVVAELQEQKKLESAKARAVEREKKEDYQRWDVLTGWFARKDAADDEHSGQRVLSERSSAKYFVDLRGSFQGKAILSLMDISSPSIKAQKTEHRTSL